MKKTLLGLLALAGVGLGGCVAVPAYDAPPVYGGPVVYAPPPSVGISLGYSSGYYARPYHRHYRHWR